MKKIIFFLFFIFSSLAMACPGCAGSVKGGGDKTVYILSAFIALTYIPFYFLFKMIIKYRHLNGQRPK